MDYEKYKTILLKAGDTRRARVVKKAAYDIKTLAPDSPAYKSVEIEGEQRNMMIISSTVTNQKIIHSMPGDDFEIGKILVWSKSHWLITERDADDEITVRGKIELCNRNIQWQNDATKEIITRWAVVDKPYFSNLNENNLMSVSSREFQIKIPYDEESSLIDIGKRLMLEEINGKPKTYRVTCVDAMTERYDRNNEQTGFLTLNLEQDQYDSSTDNNEKMICDYDEPHDTEVGNVKITYEGDPKLRLCGRGKVFKTYIYDSTEKVVCSWKIVGDENNKIYFDGTDHAHDFTGDTCRIKVDNDISLNGLKVTLEAENETKESKDSIELEVVDS